MMHFKFILFCFLCLFSIRVYSQKSPTTWYFGDHSGIQFSETGPQNIGNSAMFATEGCAVQSDSLGEILLYSNGIEVYNKEHRLVEGGGGLLGHNSAQQSSIFLPFPGSKTKYYLFTADAEGALNGINYSIIDVSFNDGLGKLIEKNVNLHKPSTEALAAIGNCTCESSKSYWITSFNSNETGKIYSYKIDESGVNSVPVVSKYNGIGQVNYFRFSPKGDLVAFLDRDFSTTGELRLIIASFDYLTGNIYNIRYEDISDTEYLYSSLIFSPDGNYLYVVKNNNIVQYNIKNYYNSLPNTIIAKDVGRLGMGQVGPDGKIYIALRDEKFLSVISNPNQWAAESNFIVHGYKLDHESFWGLPNFPEQLSYNGTISNAGKDTTICSGKSIVLAKESINQGANYMWNPIDNLDRADILNPTFNFVNTTDSIIEKSYVLTVSNNNCTRCDTIKIKINPEPDKSIYGTQSVCPGVEGVEYSVVKKEGIIYKWEIIGGQIVGPINNNIISVNWGETNSNAKVKLTYTSQCFEDSIILPVRINVELKTDLPRGEVSICKNLLNNHDYSIPNSPGSIYTWGIEGGTITSGNSTNKVNVNFDGSIQAKIWLEEFSTTKDTVCYGVSDTLFIDFFEDTSSIEIVYASVNLLDESKVEIQWQGKNLNNVFVGQDDNSFISAFYEKNEDNHILVDGMDTYSAENNFKISTINSCNQEISSSIHKIILLKASLNSDSAISLSWTDYKGWDKVLSYEVWRKIDQNDTFRLYKTLAGKENFLNQISGNEGFKHQFRVVGLNENNFRTYSNTITIEFIHPVFIPNVFTPNNDNINETFYVKNIELYPDNVMIIFNRWGKEIFRKSNYQGDWKGEGFSSGIYYYSLYLKNLNKEYKGWIQIIN